MERAICPLFCDLVKKIRKKRNSIWGRDFAFSVLDGCIFVQQRPESGEKFVGCTLLVVQLGINFY
jgi:hypothetical protein